ncbi:hypothetical protein ACPF8X_33075, partial [Streptomyces sp. G35A]
MATRDERVVRALVDAHGRTYAEEAGIRLEDTPQPLYRLLVLAHLLSARIRGSIALATARALHEAGLRDPRRMAGAGRPGKDPSQQHQQLHVAPHGQIVAEQRRRHMGLAARQPVEDRTVG